MPHTKRLGAAAIFVLALSARPAFAQGPTASELQEKVRAALRDAPSFVETIAIKPNARAPLGGTLTYTVVAPNRFHQLVSSSLGGGDDTIIIGNEVYGRKGQGWTVQTWTNELVTGFEGDVFTINVLSVGAARTSGAQSVGTFVIKDPRGGKDSDTLKCAYEPATFRPLKCENGFSVITYTYDGAGVRIETPQNPQRLDQ